MQSRRSLLIRAFFLLVSIDVVASLLISSNGLENDTVDTNLHRLLRGDYNAASHVLAAAEKEGAAVRVGEGEKEENILPWYHSSRMLLNPSTTCPWPDDITSLSDVRSGQYGSETGDCFYIYWDPSKCDITNGNNNKCPLYSEYIMCNEHRLFLTCAVYSRTFLQQKISLRGRNDTRSRY